MARALAHEASDAVRCCSELDRMRIILTLSRHCCTKLALWVACGRSVLASAVAPRVVRSARESGSAAPARTNALLTAPPAKHNNVRRLELQHEAVRRKRVSCSAAIGAGALLAAA